MWDNPKTIVISRKGELIVWNPIFGQVALGYRFVPELCWPRSGNQKGAVENLVSWVKGSLFKCRQFHDRADLEAQLTQWLIEVNTQRPSRATGITRACASSRSAAACGRCRFHQPPTLKIPVVVSARALVAYEG